MSERAQELRAAVAHVEKGKPFRYLPFVTVFERGWDDAYKADRDGSLDAVARLEAPLRERGWCGPYVSAPYSGETEWMALWAAEDQSHEPVSKGDSEARARLLAVLKVLLHDEERA